MVTNISHVGRKGGHETKMKKKKGRHGQAGEGRERIPLGELLARRFDIPADLFAGGLTLEMRGRNELYVTGCERILSYSTECIGLLVSGAELTVTGRRLCCTTYYNAEIGIEGLIDGIAFSAFTGDGKQ